MRVQPTFGPDEWIKGRAVLIDLLTGRLVGGSTLRLSGGTAGILEPPVGR